MRGFLHRLLGGATDDSGRPVPGADEWVEVFDGLEVDATNVRQALDDEGIESDVRVYVPLGAAWGATADLHVVISVRPGNIAATNAVLDAVPHLGKRL